MGLGDDPMLHPLVCLALMGDAVQYFRRGVRGHGNECDERKHQSADSEAMHRSNIPREGYGDKSVVSLVRESQWLYTDGVAMRINRPSAPIHCRRVSTARHSVSSGCGG